MKRQVSEDAAYALKYKLRLMEVVAENKLLEATIKVGEKDVRKTVAIASRRIKDCVQLYNASLRTVTDGDENMVTDRAVDTVALDTLVSAAL